MRWSGRVWVEREEKTPSSQVEGVPRAGRQSPSVSEGHREASDGVGAFQTGMPGPRELEGAGWRRVLCPCQRRSQGPCGEDKGLPTQGSHRFPRSRLSLGKTKAVSPNSWPRPYSEADPRGSCGTHTWPHRRPFWPYSRERPLPCTDWGRGGLQSDPPRSAVGSGVLGEAGIWAGLPGADCREGCPQPRTPPAPHSLAVEAENPGQDV